MPAIPDDLSVHGRKVYSQGNEDGIIAEIFRRIAPTKKTFIEFGAESGFENNTRLLLEQGWRGLWIEANPAFAKRIRRACRSSLRSGRLTFIEAFITTENINELILSSDLPRDIDLLSIDIDGNDYHVLAAITAARPRVICIEYNSSKPPPIDWVMAYDPAHRWQSDDCFGASLVAFERLLRGKGYSLVGTSFPTANAFFVRDDLVHGHFAGPFTASRFFHAVRYEDIVAYPRSRQMILGVLRQWMGLS
jgi:hypothetical protein